MAETLKIRTTNEAFLDGDCEKLVDVEGSVGNLCLACMMREDLVKPDVAKECLQDLKRAKEVNNG